MNRKRIGILLLAVLAGVILLFLADFFCSSIDIPLPFPIASRLAGYDRYCLPLAQGETPRAFVLARCGTPVEKEPGILTYPPEESLSGALYQCDAIRSVTEANNALIVEYETTGKKTVYLTFPGGAAPGSLTVYHPNTDILISARPDGARLENLLCLNLHKGEHLIFRSIGAFFHTIFGKS